MSYIKTVEEGTQFEYEVVVYTAVAKTTIAGHSFQIGDKIECRIASCVSNTDIEAEFGNGGPWGFGGTTTRSIKKLATSISFEKQIIWSRSLTKRELKELDRMS